MSNIIKKITRISEADSLSLDPFKIEWDTNDSQQNLFIVIHDESVNEATDIETEDGPERLRNIRQYRVQVNNGSTEPVNIDAEKIVIQPLRRLSNQREVIYQFDLGYARFRPGKNTVSFFEVTSPIGADPVVSKMIGKISFFLKEETNVTNIRLERPGTENTTDQTLWRAIKENSIKFIEYEHFIDKILCTDDTSVDYEGSTFSGRRRRQAKNRSPFVRSEEYNLIKFATDFYMLAKFGLTKDELIGYVGVSNKLPYYDIVIDRIKDDLTLDGQLPTIFKTDDCTEREEERLFNPFMVELIWSYWMEQGMLVQTLNVINLRFQNIKGSHYVDRLARFDADPLRPLSHILWGYIQDEQHRLSLPRRLNEYDHEYGLTLVGRAVPPITPVDSRVPFLEAFHSLLNQCTIYFHESDDTTRIADAFPILNSLKEVHLLLAEGNHNAYGNLTWTARHEMLMQQYILSRTEMREFLGGKVMVPYPETWMDRVDTMRNIQGWGGTGIVHYYELAIHGELILLSIRYGNWSDVTLDRHNAANWAQEFRNSIQRYIHAYRAVTGVDLSAITAEQIQTNGTFARQPSFLIQQRLLQDRTRTRRA